ncbi:MAG: hypothetical protein GEV28_31500 [Actinophytocola sp.]|uniref:hypothetical protein n=1 Tax=Actinophytocola sp. TaxID=1872138 RepID=UPI001325B64C|nr:hypothetical protein [Actinophytocola sp.]MPZ84668.1 hypothetical protein [Actinophytocola sp.]
MFDVPDDVTPEAAALAGAWVGADGRGRSRERLDLAITLTTRLPRTLAAIKGVRLDPYRASKIADATLSLSLEDTVIVEREILDRVEEMPAVSPGRGPTSWSTGATTSASSASAR